ncbi:MAG: two-component regulator propeller domain-containing protein [Rhodanobacteraceae bacterium]
MRARWVLGLLLACLSAGAWAAGNGSAEVPGMRNVHFRTYSVMQGLPQASAAVMVQDSTGFIWIGTQDGLARFDGYEFKVYKHDRDKPHTLSDNFVRAIVADGSGGLWVGTRSGGLDHYNPRTSHFDAVAVKHEQGDASTPVEINALAMGARGRVWIVTGGGYLQWLKPGSLSTQMAAIGPQSRLRRARVMLAMPGGGVLLGSGEGLFRVDAAGRSMSGFGPSGLDVFALALGEHNEVWVGTASAGLYHLDKHGKVLQHFTHQTGQNTNSLPDNEVRALLLDKRGTLWIAGNSAGLASLDPSAGVFRHYPHRASDPHSVAANRLWSLQESRRGLLLVGSWTNGFSIHDPATENFLQIYSVPSDPRTLPESPAMSVFGAEDGSLWAGIIEGGGLVHLDFTHGVIKRYTHDPDKPDSLANNFVHYISRARDGGLWVATVGGGLDHLRPDGSGFDHLRHDDNDPRSLASDTVLQAFEDSKGTLWVATGDQGLDERCSGCKAFRHHRHVSGDPDSLASNSLSNVLERDDGDLWVATRNAGLDRLDRHSGKFTHFTAAGAHNSGLSVNGLSALFIDSHGVLWVGTQGGALNRQISTADGSIRFRSIDHHDGLDSDSIGGILEDDAGQIWVSTLKGVSRVDRASNQVVNYSGHAGASQRGYWVNSATRLKDGRLVFGALDGITVFNPAGLPDPPRATPVITEMLIAGRPYLHDEHSAGQPPSENSDKPMIHLAHDDNDVSFEFAALNYSSPESVEYAYRLDGHDKNWVPVSWRRRSATYTNLSPGTYVLYVRARAGSDDWSKDATSLAFMILDPPWRTPWAYALYALLGVLLAWLVFWRVNLNLARRRQVQETIRDSEARLKMALWGSGTELWDIDLSQDRLYRENRLPGLAISAANVDRAPHDIIPFLHPDDRAEFIDALVRHLKGQASTFEASYRSLGSDNRWVWVLSRGQVVKRDAQGRALRISGISSDIDTLKQAEEALRALNESLESRVEQRTRELNARNADLRLALDDLTKTEHKLLEAEKMAALGGLVAGVAHEINTPLGVALTAASYLRDETRRLARQEAGKALDIDAIGRFGRKASESADIIMRNLQSANRLVKSFKQVAVAQSSEDIDLVDICQCLEQVVITLGPLVKESHHRIELDCSPDLEVRTSPGALFQIITNLVTNAMLHGFEDGKAGSIVISARREDEKVLLVFSDDGRGMSDDILARVYEPFFTTRRGQGGSGLGLPIVYNLVTQVLKGTIELQSQPGQGTRFLIRFASAPRETQSS